MDDERSISIEGRLKDLINRGGEKVSAAEVEALCCVTRVSPRRLSSPCPTPGSASEPRLLVPASDPLTMHEVQQHLQSLSLAKFKWPERLEWLAELPETAVGRVDKAGLRKAVAAKLATRTTARIGRADDTTR